VIRGQGAYRRGPYTRLTQIIAVSHVLMIPTGLVEQGSPQDCDRDDIWLASAGSPMVRVGRGAVVAAEAVVRMSPARLLPVPA
jgi:hypothetical protein